MKKFGLAVALAGTLLTSSVEYASNQESINTSSLIEKVVSSEEKKKDLSLHSTTSSIEYSYLTEKQVDADKELGFLTHIRQLHSPTYFTDAMAESMQVALILDKREGWPDYSGPKVASCTNSISRIYNRYVGGINRQEIVSCQKEIEVILTECIKLNQFDLYTEGLESGLSINENNRTDYVDKFIYLYHSLFKAMEGLNDNDNSAKYFRGGACIFSIEHQNKIIYGCESSNFHEKFIATINFAKVLYKDPSIFDARENSVLQNIFGDTNSTNKVIVFGSAHDFKNNVEEWNKEHPDKKYDLVVITPKVILEKEKAEKAEADKIEEINLRFKALEDKLKQIRGN